MYKCTPHRESADHAKYFFLHISSSYAKILREINFQPREFPRSVSRAKDREKRMREKRLNDGNNNGQLRIANPTLGGTHTIFWPLWSNNYNHYSRDCGWPRRPWPNSGRKKAKKRSKISFFLHKEIKITKKIFWGGNFYFLKKKSWFFCSFFCFLRPAFGHGRLGHPQSLEYLW